MTQNITLSGEWTPIGEGVRSGKSCTTSSTPFTGTFDGGGIVGTIYNTAVVTGNENTAASISGKTFAAGIAGNLQQEAGNTFADNLDIKVTNNLSTTPIGSISANCKDLYAYNIIINNVAKPFKVEANGSDEWIAQIGDESLRKNPMGKEKTAQKMKKMQISPRQQRKAEVCAANFDFEANLSAKCRRAFERKALCKASPPLAGDMCA